MIRKIIRIDEEKCNGCGACADACHEGAIGMVNGKAKLLRENYCDGLGDCLPACPADAISFEEREAPAYDEAAVKASKAEKSTSKPLFNIPLSAQPIMPIPSQLANWPPQIKLAPLTAPYYEGAELLIAADCTAFTYAAFHGDFMNGHVTLIGCPKLDGINYAEKLTEIIAGNDIRSVHIVRMEVPCCGGLETAVKNALVNAKKMIPRQVTTISINGEILD